MKTAIMMGNNGIANNLKTNLISCWEINETSGGGLFDAYASNDFTIFNLTLNQSGATSALTPSAFFNGTTGHAETSIDNSDLPILNQSISMWFKKSGSLETSIGGLLTRTGPGIVTKHTYVLKLASDDKLSYEYTDSVGQFSSVTYAPTTDIWLNNWVNVVVTRGGSNMKIYVNNVLKATASGGNGSMVQSISKTDSLGVFNHENNYDFNYFKGYIDQTAMWESELSEEDINDIWRNGSGLAYTDWEI